IRTTACSTAQNAANPTSSGRSVPAISSTSSGARPILPNAGNSTNCNSQSPPTQKVCASLQLMMPAWFAGRSDMTHLDDLVLDHAAGGLDRHHVAFFLADQRPGDRRTHRQLALLDVRLVVADDLVAHLLVGLDIGDVHGGTEDHLAGMRDAGDVDDLSVLQASLDITDARLDHALLLARGVVFGVFLEIAQLARLGDGLGDLRTQHGLQMLEFIFQGASALDGHREFGHDLIPAWSSCKRRTVFSGPNLSASQIA